MLQKAIYHYSIICSPFNFGFKQTFYVTISDATVCYTLFVAVRKQRRNHFSMKKIEFRETWQKHVYTQFVIDSSFREYKFQPQVSFTTVKKVLCVYQETAYPGERVLWKDFLWNSDGK